MNPLYIGLLMVLGLLLTAHGIALFVLPKTYASRTEIIVRIRTWWVIIGVITLALVTSSPFPEIIFALISFIAFKEYISLLPSRTQDRWAFGWAYISIPLQYYWVATGWYHMFLVFIPVYVFLLLPARMVFSGSPQGFLKSTSNIYWGLMTTVYIISHMAYMLQWKDVVGANGHLYTGAQMLFFLVFLTQINDVAQFVWGKSCGGRLTQRKILPLVSPNKTWEGFIGGALTTTVACTLLASLFTPMDTLHAFGLGLIIGTTGFVGDVVMSAIKRDFGVKDTGNILPGHGGILDRLDSLTFTAPLYFHLMTYWYL